MENKTKTVTLRFRVVDKNNFDEIRNGLKTVETRAASKRYRDIQKGDTLVIVCGKEKVVKEVKSAHYFKTIGGMLKTISLKKIMPSVKTIIEARKVYYGYPEYREKIKEFGVVAWEL